MIENEAFAQNQIRKEGSNRSSRGTKMNSKSIGRYSYSQVEEEANHILVSEQEEPRTILIKKRYQESDSEKESHTENPFEEEKEFHQENPIQNFNENSEQALIQNRYDLQKTLLQTQLQNYKDAFLFQSQYLSGITEKSEEES